MLHASFSIVSYQYAVSIVHTLFSIHRPSHHYTHSPEPMLQMPSSTASVHLAVPHTWCAPGRFPTPTLCYATLCSVLRMPHFIKHCSHPPNLLCFTMFLLSSHRIERTFPDSISHASPFPCHFLSLKLYFTGCTHCTHHSLKLTLHSPHPCHTICYNLFSSLSVTHSLPETVPYSP